MSLLAPLDVSFVFADSGFTDAEAAVEQQQQLKSSDADMAKVANSRVQQYLAGGKQPAAASSAATARGHKGANELEGAALRPSAAPAAARGAAQNARAAANVVVPGSTTSDQERDRPFHGYGGQYNSLGSLPGSSGVPIKSFPVATGGRVPPAAATRAEISPLQPDVIHSSLDDVPARRRAARVSRPPRSDQEPGRHSGNDPEAAAGLPPTLPSIPPLCQSKPSCMRIGVQLQP